MTGDKAANEVFITERQISVLKQKIYITKLIVAQLANSGYDAELVNILQNELFFFVPDIMDLDAILSLLISDEVALEVAEAELAALMGTAKKIITQFDYTADVVNLGKHIGYRIDTKICTLAEYIAMSNDFARHIEFMKRNPMAANMMN